MAEYCAGPVIQAKYETRSASCCGEPIDEGDDIRMVDGAAIHADCHDCSCGECD